MTELEDKVMKTELEGIGASIELKIINKWLGEIERLYVPEHLRNNGNGTLLMRMVESVAMKQRLGKLSLLCRMDNYHARFLFIKLGYEEESVLENHFKLGEHMIVYSKFL